jgi:hypothetical protein
VGWHFAIVWEEASNLITVFGSVGFGFTPAASTRVSSDTIDLQTHDIAQICGFHFLLKFEVRFWRTHARAARASVSDVTGVCH